MHAMHFMRAAYTSAVTTFTDTYLRHHDTDKREIVASAMVRGIDWIPVQLACISEQTSTDRGKKTRYLAALPNGCTFATCYIHGA